jgi:hypothetical protein
MKKNIYVIILLLLLIGCNPQKIKQLNQNQKNQIKMEVKSVLDSIIVRFVNLDTDGALKYYSTNMFAVGRDSMINYEAFKNNWIGLNKNAISIKWTQKHLAEIVLSRNYAITNLVGRLIIILKSRDTVTIDPQFYSDVYKKENGGWKIVYEHGSGIPVIKKAIKK